MYRFISKLHFSQLKFHQHLDVSSASRIKVGNKQLLALDGFIHQNQTYSSVSVYCRKYRCLNQYDNFKRNFHLSTVYSAHSKFERTCWKCDQPTSTKLWSKEELFFCSKCGFVQKPVYQLNLFEILNLEVSFDINMKNLGKAFRESQQKLHPDMFSNKTEVEQLLAEEQSSLLNKAHDTLQKPLSRAIYMLELEGFAIAEADHFTEPEFLMEVMDVNEEISDAKDINEIQNVGIENDSKIDKCIEDLKKLFQNESYEDSKNMTMKLRYYTTIQARIKDLIRDSF